MKKAFSIILCALILLPILSVFAFAIPLSSGTTKLNSQFRNGRLEGKLDYVYFSPVKGDDDTAKYPVLVWLHGKNSGKYKRAQLANYEFSNWASDEYQSRFESTGGCYLLAVRASTASDNSWSTDMTGDLYATIQYFISLNDKNIDTNRIYIAGYSTGGTMVWDMIGAYPDYFAAAFPLAAIYQPSRNTLSKAVSVSVWMFCCDKDYYQLSETEDVMPNYNYLKEAKSDLSTLRITSFTEACYADGSKKMNGTNVAAEAEHYLWESFTYDMRMEDGITQYKYSTTKDGYGHTISFEDGTGIITWLDNQSRENNTGSVGKVSFLTRLSTFFRSVISFFRNLFKK